LKLSALKLATMVTLMIAVITMSQTHYIYAENKAKELCPDYSGEWNDDKNECEIDDDDERTEYEDALCDDPEDSKKYEICQ
jgi:hypothetical protein